VVEMGGGVAVARGGVHETATGSVVTRTNLQSIPKCRIAFTKTNSQREPEGWGRGFWRKDIWEVGWNMTTSRKVLQNWVLYFG
jgi:hypothetical protein